MAASDWLKRMLFIIHEIHDVELKRGFLRALVA